MSDANDKPMLVGSLRDDLMALVYRIVSASRTSELAVWVDDLADVYMAHARAFPMVDFKWLVGIYDCNSGRADVEQDLDDYRRRRAL
jgi:hypothetical protein